MLTKYLVKCLALSVITAPILLTACGGGGGSGGNPPPPQPPTNEIPSPPQGAISSLQKGVFSFESAATRPLALSADRSQLYALNIPDGRVEIFEIDRQDQLSLVQSVPVGIDPVALALHPSGHQLWVVNHLSDSVSIIDLQDEIPSVMRTLLVGDEPRDIVFANGQAFISTAHRGQHRTHLSIADAFDDLNGDPELHQPGIGRADLWVFDANDQGQALGGTPIKIIEMFGDTPRGLAVSEDEKTVYAAIFNSGNQTSVVHESVMCRGFEDDPAGILGTGELRAGNEPCIAGNIPEADATSSPNGTAKNLPASRPMPSTNAAGDPQPWTGMIVKYDNDSGEWRDSRDLNYSNGIRFFLPDRDVFAIDTETLTPKKSFQHVGTTLFNIAVNPVSGMLYVSNTDAQNHIRFEGPGEHGGSTVQGNIAHTRITVIDPVSGSVRARHLNPHIDYSELKSTPSTKQATVSTITELQVSKDGNTLYATALGSNQVAVYNTSDLENDELWDGNGIDFDPQQALRRHIPIEQGPQGILLDEMKNSGRGQAYVLSRFDNSIHVVDMTTGETRQTVAMYNPEPESLQAGRFMLYDAHRSSSNGESSCASCHVFGDMDQLAWNLGNPDGGNTENTNPFPIENILNLGCDFVGPEDDSCQLRQIVNGDGETRSFSSMKGPMTTQTMRGMSTHGHLHWRGDRVNGYFGIERDNNSDGDNNPDTRDMEALDERLSFKNFIVAFEGLLGLEVDLEGGIEASGKSSERLALERDMENFADFMLQIQLPPNPIRPLDNSLSLSAAAGKDFFEGQRRSDGLEYDQLANGPEVDGMNCEGCHTHDNAKGFYGTDGKVGSGGEILILKVPHFRNLYQKVGMFGLPNREGFLPSYTDSHQGDQIRGFGFLHDGATDTLFNFLSGGVFDNGNIHCGETRDGVPDWAGCSFNDGQSVGIPDDETRQAVVDYLMEFDSDLAPIVGQQITLYPGAPSSMYERVQLLEQRAEANFVSKVLGGTVKECDLIASTVIDGERINYWFQAETGNFRSDKQGEQNISAKALRDSAGQSERKITYTCAVPGTGYRIALDRNLDGVLNRDERS